MKNTRKIIIVFIILIGCYISSKVYAIDTVLADYSSNIQVYKYYSEFNVETQSHQIVKRDDGKIYLKVYYRVPNEIRGKILKYNQIFSQYSQNYFRLYILTSGMYAPLSFIHAYSGTNNCGEYTGYYELSPSWAGKYIADFIMLNGDYSINKFENSLTAGYGYPGYTNDDESFSVSFRVNTNMYLNPSWWNVAPTVSLNTPDNQTLSNVEGNNILTINGIVNDQNAGDSVAVKYSIEGVPAHQAITIATITSNGTNQPFTYNVIIDDTISGATHTLKVWAVDSYDVSSPVVTRTFTVEREVGSSGEPYIRAVTSEGKAYNIDNITYNYSEVTNRVMTNNIGAGRPFYLREWTHKLAGTDNTFYDYGSISAYIGNHQMRVVTSEGKAFDVDVDSGSYTEITTTFMNNNFGVGKPFYLREYSKYINNYGPFVFYDFGSAMAYIGNDTFRVVTAEGKAFDVDKDTGNYTEVTSSFLINNWGSGKPFYQREYNYTIGGQTHTFYDFGSSMCYIGNNIIRVVTSENKVFDVNKDTGAYTEVTSTVPLVCFGSGKPFFTKTYPVNIGGIGYTFYDFGSTLAYIDPTLIDSQGINLECSIPEEIEAYDKITLAGTASDVNNNNLTISAAINGVTKTISLTNTANPQEWILEWDVQADNIPEGDYSNIAITANNGIGQLKRIAYNGTISVYRIQNFTGKTVIYEYDDAGRLTKRRAVVSS